MKTIYKYELDLNAEEQRIWLPKGAKLLSVGNQTGNLVLWAEINTAKPDTVALIKIFGTGQPDIETQGLEFLGTVQMYGGSLVLHVYGII